MSPTRRQALAQLASLAAPPLTRWTFVVDDPLDGVPIFAKAIYDVVGLPTTGSSAEWARLFPERMQRDALEIARLRTAGAIILGKTAADDFAYRGNGTSSHTGQVLVP